MSPDPKENSVLLQDVEDAWPLGSWARQGELSDFCAPPDPSPLFTLLRALEALFSGFLLGLSNRRPSQDIEGR